MVKINLINYNEQPNILLDIANCIEDKYTLEEVRLFRYYGFSIYDC